MSTICPEHSNEEVRFHCEECVRFICDECVVSDCKDHDKVRLLTFIERKRKECQDFIDNVKGTKIDEIETRIATLSSSRDQYYLNIEKEIQSIKNRTEKLKQILDEIDNDVISQLTKVKETMKVEIETFLESEQRKLVNTQKMVENYKEVVLFDDKILEIHNENRLSSYPEAETQPLPILKSPKYVLGSGNEKGMLTVLHGYIDEGDYEDVDPRQMIDKLSDDVDARQNLDKLPDDDDDDAKGSGFVEVRNKIEIAQSDEPFSSEEEILYMACNEKGLKWVLGKKTLWEIKDNGSNRLMEKHMKTPETSAENVAISSKGVLFMLNLSKACIILYKPSSSTVRKLMKKDAEKSTFLITTPLYPMCIGAMFHNEIVVCLGENSQGKDATDFIYIRWHQIEPKYGKLMRELKLNSKEHQISNPVSITPNAINELLIINQEKDKNTSIVCLKSDGNVKFRYPKYDSSDCHFVGVACLSDGTSVILEQSEPSLHLIDADGILLQKDPTDVNPTCLTKDTNDNLWIGYSSGVIQSVAYKHTRIYDEVLQI